MDESKHEVLQIRDALIENRLALLSSIQEKINQSYKNSDYKDNPTVLLDGAYNQALSELNDYLESLK